MPGAVSLRTTQPAPARTVTLSPADYEALFGAQLAEIRRSMQDADEYLGQLEEAGDRTTGTISSSAELSVRILRENLDALAALGWPVP